MRAIAFNCSLMPRFVLLLVSAVLVGATLGCVVSRRPSASGQHPSIRIQTFGEMRRVLRLGETEAKVELVELVEELSERGGGRAVIGVGALEDLRGEVTIVGGRIFVSEVHPPGRTIETRPAVAGDQAAMLIAAGGVDWTCCEVGSIDSYAELEDRIREELVREGADLSKPVPVWFRGTAESVQAHVTDGACPIAEPEGAPPGRIEDASGEVDIVGFYVEGSAGVFTHHDRRSHLHVVTTEGAGHLEEVRLERGELRLHARPDRARGESALKSRTGGQRPIAN